MCIQKALNGYGRMYICKKEKKEKTIISKEEIKLRVSREHRSSWRGERKNGNYVIITNVLSEIFVKGYENNNKILSNKTQNREGRNGSVVKRSCSFRGLRPRVGPQYSYFGSQLSNSTSKRPGAVLWTLWV